MPQFANVYDMLNCSLNEMLYVAKYSIDTRKEKIENFKDDKGCFGFPAAVLLFTITDTIGSMFRGTGIKIVRNGNKQDQIKGSYASHFYILNSSFYGQQLTTSVIDGIYRSYRDLLVHNSSLPQGYFLAIGSESDDPFVCCTDKKGNLHAVCINLRAYYRISSNAVSRFLPYFDEKRKEFASSKILASIQKRRAKVQTIIDVPIASSGATISIVTKMEQR